MKMNNMHVIYILICFIYYYYLKLGIIVSGVSTVREDTNGCAKAIYVCFGYIFNDCVIIFIWYYNGS